MTSLEERVLIYTALAVVCAFLGTFAGLAAGILTFIQIAAIIEALFWFGMPQPSALRRRRQRTLYKNLARPYFAADNFSVDNFSTDNFSTDSKGV